MKAKFDIWLLDEANIYVFNYCRVLNKKKTVLAHSPKYSCVTFHVYYSAPVSSDLFSASHRT